MDRRTFLRGAALTVGSAVLAGCSPAARPSAASPGPPSPASPSSSGPTALASSARSRSVIVVGAGPAGLAAARQPTVDGFAVTVLEARDRIGGRAWTSDALGVPVDLGASWIHGIDGNPMTDLARAAGVELVLTRDSAYATFDVDGRRLKANEDDLLYNHYQAILDKAVGSSRDPSRESVAAAFARTLAAGSKDTVPPRGLDPSLVERYLTWIFATEVGLDWAADLDELSVGAQNDGDDYTGAWAQLVGGYRAVLAPVASTLDVRLGERVEAVEVGDGVTVRTDLSSHTADRAILTLPLGVLKSGDVRFSPALPDATQGAIDRLGMGDFFKVAMRFPAMDLAPASTGSAASARPPSSSG